MRPAIQKFREEYREQMSVRYSPVLHASFVLLSGLCFVVYNFAKLSLGFNAALSFVLGLVIFNFGEYLIHRELGHKKRDFAKIFFKRHSLEHHHFFDHQYMSIDKLRDWRVTLFPAWLVVVIIVTACVSGYFWNYVIATDRHALAAGIVFCYVLYEFMHTCFHLPEQHVLANLPGIKVMRLWHQEHHVPASMHQYNFNLTFPLADYVLSTRKVSISKKSKS